MSMLMMFGIIIGSAVLVGLIGSAIFGFKSGPDYSLETVGKVLDTSDNKWKTQEQIDLDRIESMVNSVRDDMKKNSITIG